MSEVTSKICTLPRKELEQTTEALWVQAKNIQRLLYLLLDNLEQDFDETRARSIVEDTVTLSFQRRGIDVDLWLVGEAWGKAVDLEKMIEGLCDDAELTDSAGRIVA